MTQIEVKINPDVTPAGSDLSVVNAARRSFNTRSEWENVEELWCSPFVNMPNAQGDEVRHEMMNPFVKPILKEKDKRLLEFLARGMTAADFEALCDDVDGAISDVNRSDLVELLWQWRNTPTHDTPFNHTFISFEVKMPVFTARQLVKTEYTILSEASRRYITDGIEFYEPPTWRKQSESVKQGSYGEINGSCVRDDSGEYTHPRFLNDDVSTYCLRAYKEMVSAGVAIEQARMVLPQSMMIEATWSGTLGAFAKMCRERCHPEAQYEARVVANQVYEYLKKYYPVGAVALVEGV